MAAIKITARLEQLSCPDCANMIGGVVSRINGVQTAEVRFATSKLLVQYDDSLTDWDTIASTVTKLGYKILSTRRG